MATQPLQPSLSSETPLSSSSSSSSTGTRTNLSDEQRHIVEQIRPPFHRHGEGRVIRITAGAGAGKTTTLLHLAERCAALGHTHVTYLTYTRATAEDTRKKITQQMMVQSSSSSSCSTRKFHLDARTLHSASSQALRKFREQQQQQADEMTKGSDFAAVESEGAMQSKIAQTLRNEIDHFLVPCYNEISGRLLLSLEQREALRRRAAKQVAYFIFKTLSQFCHSDLSLRDWKDPSLPSWRREYYPAVQFHTRHDRNAETMGFLIADYSCQTGWYVDQASALFEVHLQNLKTYDLEMKRAQLLGLELPGSVILVDECQDCDACQISWVVQQATKYHKQVVCVGDPAQTIFSFRGAKSQNLMNIEKSFPHNNNGQSSSSSSSPPTPQLQVVSCHLTRSWRFGPQIAKMANLVLFAKEYSPQTPPASSFKAKQWDPYRLIGAASSPGEVTCKSLVKSWHVTREPFTLLAFSNAELMEAALLMLGFDNIQENETSSNSSVVQSDTTTSAKVDNAFPKFHVNSKGSNSGRKKFLKDMRKIQVIFDLFMSRPELTSFPTNKFPEFVGEQHSWDSFVKQVEAREMKDYSSSIAIVEKYENKTMEAISMFYEKVLEKPSDADDADVILSTIHSAKGMEWDKVHVYSDIVPLALQKPKAGQKCMFDFKSYGDEVNLLYVACTRAKKVLSVPSHVYALLSECDAIYEWILQNPESATAVQPTLFGSNHNMTYAETQQLVYRDIVAPLRVECNLANDQMLTDAMFQGHAGRGVSANNGDLVRPGAVSSNAHATLPPVSQDDVLPTDVTSLNTEGNSSPRDERVATTDAVHPDGITSESNARILSSGTTSDEAGPVAQVNEDSSLPRIRDSSQRRRPRRQRRQSREDYAPRLTKRVCVDSSAI